MTDFVQTMRNWKRMCKYFEEHYEDRCCNYCPLKSCGAIWEIDRENWEDFERKINTWAAENPRVASPSLREYLVNIGLIKETVLWNYNEQETIKYFLNEKADSTIPPEVAEKLGLKPQY